MRTAQTPAISPLQPRMCWHTCPVSAKPQPDAITTPSECESVSKPNTAQYAHFVFNTLDQDRSGLLSFEEFVTGLSILSRGTIEEKLRWTFSLYDINGDGYITKEEMTEIVNAIYDLMGRIVDPMLDDEVVREKVERLFQKMDLNRDGVLTIDEFLDCCLHDEDITRSMGVFDSNF